MNERPRRGMCGKGAAAEKGGGGGGGGGEKLRRNVSINVLLCKNPATRSVIEARGRPARAGMADEDEGITQS